MGVFISSIYIKRDRDKIDKFSMEWMSNNLTQEGMEQMIKNMSSTPHMKEKMKKKEKTKEEVANDWMRLAAFQQ